MSAVRFTREFLVARVEEAARAAGLDPKSTDALLRVAREAMFVARGTHRTIEGVDCPAVQAGLFDPYEDGPDEDAITARFVAADRFIHVFDDVTRAAATPLLGHAPAKIIEVIDP